MRWNLKEAMPWMLPVALLSACGGVPGTDDPETLGESAQALISAPATPGSGNIGDSFPYAQSLAVGGANQSQCGNAPGYDGYKIQVTAGSQLKLEVTHLGSSMYLDTGLFLYGPKDANGSYGSAVLFQDDDSGYGTLSKIGVATLPQGGEYLAVVGWGNAAGKQYRLQVDCVGGACIPQPQPAPANASLALVEQPISPSLQATLDTANTVHEGRYSYLRRFDYVWPYSGEATVDQAAAAVLAQGLYSGYRSYPTPQVFPYADLLPRMFWQYQPLHPAILSTYGNGTENVQVKQYGREVTPTGPNQSNWRTLNVVLFPKSFKVIVYEQSETEI